MKKIFENQGDALRVLSNSAMKNILGGTQPQESTEDGVCRVHCANWDDNLYVRIGDCASLAQDKCRGEVEHCFCE